MKNYLIIFLFSSILFLGCKSQNIKTELENNALPQHSVSVREHSLQAVLWQQKSAEYTALTYQAFNLAKIRLDSILNVVNNSAKPIAIVTDIDETVLDNSPYSGKQIELDEDYTSSRWKEWVNLKKAKPVPGALTFFNYAASKGVAIYYISNRNIQQTTETIENLKLVGFPNVDAAHVLLKSTTSGKKPRRDIVEKTHNIVLLLGDNLSDFSTVFEDHSTEDRVESAYKLQHNFGDKFIVLPNPIYGDWETKGIFEGNYKWTTFQKDSIRRKKVISY